MPAMEIPIETKNDNTSCSSGRKRTNIVSPWGLRYHRHENTWKNPPSRFSSFSCAGRTLLMVGGSGSTDQTKPSLCGGGCRTPQKRSVMSAEPPLAPASERVSCWQESLGMVPGQFDNAEEEKHANRGGEVMEHIPPPKKTAENIERVPIGQFGNAEEDEELGKEKERMAEVGANQAKRKECTTRVNERISKRVRKRKNQELEVISISSTETEPENQQVQCSRKSTEDSNAGGAVPKTVVVCEAHLAHDSNSQANLSYSHSNEGASQSSTPLPLVVSAGKFQEIQPPTVQACELTEDRKHCSSPLSLPSSLLVSDGSHPPPLDVEHPSVWLFAFNYIPPPPVWWTNYIRRLNAENDTKRRSLPTALRSDVTQSAWTKHDVLLNFVDQRTKQSSCGTSNFRRCIRAYIQCYRTLATEGARRVLAQNLVNYARWQGTQFWEQNPVTNVRVVDDCSRDGWNECENWTKVEWFVLKRFENKVMEKSKQIGTQACCNPRNPAVASALAQYSTLGPRASEATDKLGNLTLTDLEAAALNTVQKIVQHPSSMLIPTLEQSELHPPPAFWRRTAVSRCWHPLRRTDANPEWEKHDIRLGRGGSSKMSSGNKWYSTFLDAYVPVYKALPTILKLKLAMNLLNYVRWRGRRFWRIAQQDEREQGENSTVVWEEYCDWKQLIHTFSERLRGVHFQKETTAVAGNTAENLVGCQKEKRDGSRRQEFTLEYIEMSIGHPQQQDSKKRRNGAAHGSRCEGHRKSPPTRAAGSEITGTACTQDHFVPRGSCEINNVGTDKNSAQEDTESTKQNKERTFHHTNNLLSSIGKLVQRTTARVASKQGEERPCKCPSAASEGSAKTDSSVKTTRGEYILTSTVSLTPAQGGGLAIVNGIDSHPSQLLISSGAKSLEPPPAGWYQITGSQHPSCFAPKDLNQWTKYDILLGTRGRKSEGNKWYFELMQSYTPVFQSLPTAQKTNLAMNLLNYIRWKGRRFWCVAYDNGVNGGLVWDECLKWGFLVEKLMARMRKKMSRTTIGNSSKFKGHDMTIIEDSKRSGDTKEIVFSQESESTVTGYLKCTQHGGAAMTSSRGNGHQDSTPTRNSAEARDSNTDRTDADEKLVEFGAQKFAGLSPEKRGTRNTIVARGLPLSKVSRSQGVSSESNEIDSGPSNERSDEEPRPSKRRRNDPESGSLSPCSPPTTATPLQDEKHDAQSLDAGQAHGLGPNVDIQLPAAATRLVARRRIVQKTPNAECQSNTLAI